MYLVQILLPLRDNDGEPFPRAALDRVRHELTERFGGATAYMRAPAAGLWKDDDGDVARDEVVAVEAMVHHLDLEWWRLYRADLEHRFRQDEVVIRTIACARI